LRGKLKQYFAENRPKYPKKKKKGTFQQERAYEIMLLQ
jgi:hypothetical protein